MDEKTLLREAALQMFEKLDGPLRERVLWAASKAIEKQAKAHGLPPDECLTSELVEEIALCSLEWIIGNQWALMSEFISQEEWERIFREEVMRLYQPSQGEIPTDALLEAVLKRLTREYPNAFRRPTPRPPKGEE